MTDEITFINTCPVLPSADISKDLLWYQVNTGFDCVWSDKMYAILRRANIILHLQWHTDTNDDPLLGGSVVRIFVKNIKPLYNEFVARGSVKGDRLNMGTAWGTNEFGFFDLNNNAILFVEDLAA